MMQITKVLIPIILGLSGNFIMSLFGMVHGLPAVDYYAEVHTQFLNKFMHFLFMPFTLYGILLLFPTIFCFTNIHFVNEFKKCVYITYIVHYLTFNKFGAVLTAFYAYPSLHYAIKDQDFSSRFYTMMRGLFFMVFALGIQERFGHYLSGDPASRVEAIPNAIIYAPYFGINGVLRY